MISYLKSIEKYKDFVFYNDATEGCSPEITAVETLKFALRDYRNSTLDETSSKTVLAVNIGKLQDLVEDDEFREGFSDLYSIAGDTIEFANPVIGINEPAPANFPILLKILRLVKNAEIPKQISAISICKIKYPR